MMNYWYFYVECGIYNVVFYKEYLVGVCGMVGDGDSYVIVDVIRYVWGVRCSRGKEMEGFNWIL